MSNCSTISSMFAPASRFSNTADTGIRVFLKTHTPLSRSGTGSTAGQWDQSRFGILYPSFHHSFLEKGCGSELWHPLRVKLFFATALALLPIYIWSPPARL